MKGYGLVTFPLPRRRFGRSVRQHCHNNEILHQTKNPPKIVQENG
jgi:hypothetical protein